MRTLCDACESAAAVVFCAADEAALCSACDDKVHMCNKLASRHVRVGLASPSDVPRCDICENAPDGTSLCLQCDMIVHVGGKRTHGRYLLLRQRVEFPGHKSAHSDDQALPLMDQNEKRVQNQSPIVISGENHQNHRPSSVEVPDGDADGHAKMDSKMIDLNMKPNRMHDQASYNEQ
ncbi:hypothetical protein BT93_I0683 [Corymbia citriodora subsp. variegata]|nr:hypothetical protein BT93_I0683 [Corymbia citriodora subsp. variegata]